jgi:hypothetical protein
MRGDAAGASLVNLRRHAPEVSSHDAREIPLCAYRRGRFARSAGARGYVSGSPSNRFYERHGFKLIERGEFDNHYLRASNAGGA